MTATNKYNLKSIDRRAPPSHRYQGPSQRRRVWLKTMQSFYEREMEEEAISTVTDYFKGVITRGRDSWPRGPAAHKKKSINTYRVVKLPPLFWASEIRQRFLIYRAYPFNIITSSSSGLWRVRETGCSHQSSRLIIDVSSLPVHGACFDAANNRLACYLFVALRSTHITLLQVFLLAALLLAWLSLSHSSWFWCVAALLACSSSSSSLQRQPADTFLWEGGLGCVSKGRRTRRRE